MTGAELIPLSSDTLAQFAHVGWGAMLVFIITLLSKRLWLAVALVAGFATGKEFIYDYIWEDAVTRGSSPKDWAFWIVGVAVALGVIIWRRSRKKVAA